MKPEWKAVVLIDNLTRGCLTAEWGLSFMIWFKGRKILLDTGESGAFAENAALMEIDLTDTDWGVLSHTHYDHSDGMEVFFTSNPSAPFLLRKGSGENCYGLNSEGKVHYIGIRRGTLSKWKERVVYVDGDYSPGEQIWLIPHKGGSLEQTGKRAGMYIEPVCESGSEGSGRFSKDRNDTFENTDGLVTDCFAHEQSLVLDTSEGLVIFNSCSHSGPDRILREVHETFPDKKICAYIGGMHLFRSAPEEVRALADLLRQFDVSQIWTGHCTGEEGFAILREELGDRVRQFRTGDWIMGAAGDGTVDKR